MLLCAGAARQAAAESAPPRSRGYDFGCRGFGRSLGTERLPELPKSPESPKLNSSGLESPGNFGNPGNRRSAKELVPIDYRYDVKSSGPGGDSRRPIGGTAMKVIPAVLAFSLPISPSFAHPPTLSHPSPRIPHLF